MEEEQELAWERRRAEELGFKPQRECDLNWLLPYADKLDEESAALLKDIKYYLGKAVMFREMRPAIAIWTSKLIKYIRVFGLKFSKDDHLTLIHLVLELILIPDLEPTKLHKFFTLFTMLTKRRYLISPEELTIQWRPLYDLGVHLFDKNHARIGMLHYATPPSRQELLLSNFFKRPGQTEANDSLFLPSLDISGVSVDKEESLVSAYESFIHCCQPYFKVDATKEILAEFLPHFDLWVNDTQIVIDRLIYFLPVCLPNKYAEHGYKLWLDDMLTLWYTCYNSKASIGLLLGLFADLAKRNPGAVDWSPHVPLMFARFMHSLNLPVCYKYSGTQTQFNLSTKDMAQWIVWAMCHDGLVLKHLRTFLNGVESYLHSANSGRWSHRLRDLLRKLSRAFLFRVHRERSPKFQRTWENLTPESHRIRDQDIDEFVQILLPSALLAVHNRGGGGDTSSALQHLSTLRPALVVPPLLQKLYSSLESLTEPHRVTAAMQAIVAVARPMIRGALCDFPEGPTHVANILLASLPGIDPNDMKKTLVTLHLISQFSMMITYIDCSNASEYWSDLTEEESLVCASTAQFEDFVLMYLERMFLIIESTTMEQVRLETRDSESVKSKMESLLESVLSSSTTVVLMQSSQSIVVEALRKFKTFATGATFETRVSGRHVGLMLRSFLRASPKATAAAFIPYLCNELTELLTDDSLHEQTAPRELLYHLLLLSNSVDTDGPTLREYLPLIFPVLDRALQAEGREAYEQACSILQHVVVTLSNLHCEEFRNSTKNFDEAPKEWLPIREWGNGYPTHAAKIKWTMPGPEEVKVLQHMVERYAAPELERLEGWCNGSELSKETRHRSLLILQSVMVCQPILKPLNEPVDYIVESLIPLTPFHLIDGSCCTLQLNGIDIRKVVGGRCYAVQKKLLEEKSDDTRSLECLVNIWDTLCCAGRASRGSGGCAESRCRTYAVAERTLDGRGGPTPGSGRLRCLLTDGAFTLHNIRVDLQSDAGPSKDTMQYIYGLIDVSTYIYPVVRMAAQLRVHWLLSHYAYSCRIASRVLLPRLCPDREQVTEDEAHAQHKGALYLLCGPRNSPIAAKQDWSVLHELWPAVLSAPLSEKPTIVRLENAFCEIVARHIPTLNTTLHITDSCVRAAKRLLSPEQLEKLEMEASSCDPKITEKTCSDENEAKYLELMERLVQIAEDPETVWRRVVIALSLLMVSSNLQTRYPPSVTRLAVNSLLHDNIQIRKMAVKFTLYVLKQNKQTHGKMRVDPYEIAGVTRPEKFVPGYRDDIDWAIYSEDKIPKTDEDWKRPGMFSNVGFYCWPEKLEVYKPWYEQPPAVRPLDQMTESQRIIYQFFTDEQNVTKLVGFLSAEDKKGKDKFSGFRFSMFKSVFRSYGLPVARIYLSHALKHAGESHEASQRFAAEIAAATVRATKHWNRDDTQALLQEVGEVFRIGLSSLTNESADDWGSCLATAAEHIDPHRSAHIIKVWTEVCIPVACDGEDPDASVDSSFKTSGRLYALAGALAAISWRGARLCTQFLKRLQEANFIQHPYQNIRDKMGSILMTVFDQELTFPGGQPGPAPVYAQFLAEVKPKLAPLYDKNGEIIVQTRGACASVARYDAPRPSPPRGDTVPTPGESVIAVGSVARLAADLGQTRAPSDETGTSTSGMTVEVHKEIELSDRLDGGLRLCGEDTAAVEQEDHQRAINLLTTLLRSTFGCLIRGARGLAPEHYELIHAACALSARGPPQSHDELAQSSDAYLSGIAYMHHDERMFDIGMDTVERICASSSWWARLSVVEFSQSLLFYSLPLLRDSEDRARRAEAVAINNMKDTRLEVRTAAAKLLTGLMHCGALTDENATLTQLIKRCRSKNLIERHSGVLGLCAYVSSRPYTLAPRLGEVLAELCRHTNGPDPIPATLRQCLADFRRTHQDDWAAHREALTEDELDLLADLAAPPAYCA